MVIQNVIQHKILNIFHFIHFHCNETQSYPSLNAVGSVPIYIHINKIHNYNLQVLNSYQKYNIKVIISYLLLIDYYLIELCIYLRHAYTTITIQNYSKIYTQQWIRPNAITISWFLPSLLDDDYLTSYSMELVYYLLSFSDYETLFDFSVACSQDFLFSFF